VDFYLEDNNLWIYNQSAVIPFRLKNGEYQILLITSSSGRRWIIPKGIIEPNLSPADSAAQEAYEEAGIKGEIYPQIICNFEYKKWGGTCTVEVYLMEVKQEYQIWPECSLRKRRWCSPLEAQKLCDIKELKIILKEFNNHIIQITNSSNS
jgi:8-oxo-dGTP pyrophosphatase MutT (NUDIX family)